MKDRPRDRPRIQGPCFWAKVLAGPLILGLSFILGQLVLYFGVLFAGRGGRGERLPFPLSIWGAKEKPPVTVTFGFGVITACVSTAIASCVSAVAVIYLAKSLGVEAS